MAKQRIGLQSFFSPNEQGFFKPFAEYASVQRERKEAALGEVRKTLSEKQVYGAYAANANKILEDQVKEIAGSLDVDPTAYTDAVGKYLRYYNYSEQFKGFINDAAASYKADNEVDYNTALDAVRKQYVKDGSLDELEKNIMNGVDAEKVLLETPGALNAETVIKNRMDKLGDVDTMIKQASEKLRQSGQFYLAQDTESIRKKVNQAVEFDANGNARVKDAKVLEELGITSMMLGDRRVDAVVSQQLQAAGKELTDENKKEQLRQMMQPFAAGTLAKDKEAKMLEDPTWKMRLQESELALQRARLAMQQQKENPQPLELMADKVGAIYKAMGDVQANNPQTIFKRYQRNTKEGAAVKSPEGKPFIASTRELEGETVTAYGKRYRSNFMLIDEDFNLWMNVQEISEQKKPVTERGMDKDGFMVEKTTPAGVKYGPEKLIRFDPSFIEAGSTPAMQKEYNKIMVPLEQYRRHLQSRVKTPANIKAQETLMDVEEEIKAPKKPDKFGFEPFNQ